MVLLERVGTWIIVSKRTASNNNGWRHLAFADEVNEVFKKKAQIAR